MVGLDNGDALLLSSSSSEPDDSLIAYVKLEAPAPDGLSIRRSRNKTLKKLFKFNSQD